MVGAAFPANIPALLWLGVIAVWSLQTTGRNIALNHPPRSFPKGPGVTRAGALRVYASRVAM